MKKVSKSPITLKTGPKRSSINPAKIEAAVRLIANGITNQVLTSGKSRNTFLLSNGSKVVVRMGRGAGRSYTPPTVILIAPDGTRKQLPSRIATKGEAASYAPARQYAKAH